MINGLKIVGLNNISCPPVHVNGFQIVTDSAGFAIMRNDHCFTTRRTLAAAMKVASESYWGRKQRDKRRSKSVNWSNMKLSDLLEEAK